MLLLGLFQSIVLLVGAPRCPEAQETRKFSEDALPDAAIARLGSSRLKAGGAIYILAVSPEGKRIATAGPEKQVLIWDLESGRCLCRVSASPTSHDTLAFSADGKLLYVGGYDGVVGYDPSTGKSAGKSYGDASHVMGICGVALSKDGRLLVSGTPDPKQSSLRIWDTTSGNELPAPKFRATNSFSLSLSADGKRLAAGGEMGWVRVWELPSGKELLDLKAHPERVHAIALSPTGAFLASTGDDEVVALWSVPEGKRLVELKGHTGWISTLAWMPDETLVATAAWDGFIRVYDAPTGKLVPSPPGPLGHVSVVRFSPDGKTVIGAGYSGAIGLWDVRTGKNLLDRPGHDGPVMDLSVSPDGRTLASITRWERKIRLWDVPSRREIRSLTDPGYPAAIAYSRDGSILASAGERGTVLWDPAGGHEVRRFEGGKERVHASSVTFTPDGKRAITASLQGIVLWNVDSGEKQLLLDLRDRVSSERVVRYSPDGKILVTSDGGSEILTWGTDDYKGQHSFDASSKVKPVLRAGKQVPPIASAITFSPDSTLLVAGGPNGAIRIWDVSSRKEIAGFAPTHSSILSLAFSPEGSLLASADDDGVIRLWETRSGAELRAYRGHEGEVNSLVFVEGGTRLASGGRDTTILLWRVIPDLEPGHALKIDPCWEDLASCNPARAYRAIEELVRCGNRAVDGLKEKLHPVPLETLRKWIEGLQDENAEAREEALTRLSLTGGESQDLLEKTLRAGAPGETRERVKTLLARLNPPVIQSPGRLRILRAADVLAWIGTAEAEAALGTLAEERKGTLEGTRAELARDRVRLNRR